MNALLDAALVYASHGWPVFPCDRKKRPLTPHGFKDATTDPEQIREWWKKWPEAAIGVPTGPSINAWVLDVDMPKAGEQSGYDTLGQLVATHGPLPTTKQQQTGSGGCQYFFAWPDGFVIRNNARTKLGPGLDIRGEGGYVIVPPSRNEAGQYKWLSKPGTVLAQAPEWLIQIVKESPRPTPAIRTQGRTSAYGESALARELATLSSATPGHRNDQLNVSAFCLGQLIAGGELDQTQVETALLGLAIALGLPQWQSEKTIASGIGGGMKEPRTCPKDIEYISDISDISDNSDFSDLSEPVSQIQPQSAMSDTGVFTQVEDGNEMRVSALVREWVINSTGSFHAFEIDREFGFVTRAEKKARANALTYLLRKEYIEKDKNKTGKYHIIQGDVEEIDWDGEHLEEVPVKLPLGLDDLVSVGPRSLIVVEGVTNAGKSLFGLQTLDLNLDSEFPLWYLFSEGHPGEVVRRVRPNTNWPVWKSRVHAAPRAADPHQVIRLKNPNGITVVDYIDASDGKYYKIAGQVADVWAALEDGVSIILLQKKSNSETAMGGEQVRHKPRLVLTMDLLHKHEAFAISVLKIQKCKTPKVDGKNPDGKEIHVGITYGWNFHVLQDWRFCSGAERKKNLPGYIQDMHSMLGLGGVDKEVKRRASYAFEFHLDSGEVRGINWKDLEKWKEAYPALNVDRELAQIQVRTRSGASLKAKGWFHQLAGILAKENDRATVAAQTVPF